MGCCSGKGGDLSLDSLENMKIEVTGVASVDDFGSKIQELLDSVKEIGKPYLEKKDQILELTKFKGKKNVTMRHVILGMFVFAGSNIPNHDFTRLNIKFTEDSPYVQATLSTAPKSEDCDKAL